MKLNSIVAFATLLPCLAFAASLRGEQQHDKTNAETASRSLKGRENNSGSDHDDFDEDYFVKIYDPQYRNRCLTFDPSDDYYVKFSDCHTSEYQNWYYDHSYKAVRSFHDDYKDYCLTLDDPDKPRKSNRDGYLRLTKCDRSKYQKWDYDSDDYRFHSGWGQDECMDYCRSCGDYVHTRKCDKEYDQDQQYLFGNKFF